MTTTPAPASPVAEFVRLGYRGASLHFRVQTGDLETFRACVHAIGAYNDFRPAAVSLRLGGIFGQCECMEVGREGSPVIYAHLPFWVRPARRPRPRGMRPDPGGQPQVRGA